MSYEDLGGRRDIPASYAMAIGHPCPTCGAGMGEWCVNEHDQVKAHPCVSRVKK